MTISILNMIGSGINQFIEVGPKNVLSGLIKRITKDCSINNFGEKADLDKI